MGGQGREGNSCLAIPCDFQSILIFDLLFAGGKAKPLKAAKKEKKELDEDDLAFKERQRAGKS